MFFRMRKTTTLIMLLCSAAGFGCPNTGGSSGDPEPQIQVLELDYPHATFAAGTEVDVACLDAGTQGLHTVGMACDCLHLHSTTGIQIEGTTTLTADLAPDECGHGCLKVVDKSDVDFFCGGLDVDDPDHPRSGLCVEAPCG